jgi:hypothetical protein
MKYTDRVYGDFEISEPVILELISSPSLQRLRGIDQAGYLEPYFPNTSYSRFEHSVGDYLLLKLFGASIEEQIAGLIHDVSHSAFSHCIDYVVKTGTEEKHGHQDAIFGTFVRKSEIPEIIKKYNFDLEYILDDNNFPLKENNLPDLCSDRIDYTLRNAIVFKEIESAIECIQSLSTDGGRWIFLDFESAKRFAELFLRLNTVYYSGIPSALMFLTVSDYLRHALSNGYISETDLYTTDTFVLSKIAPHINDDAKLMLLYDRMHNKIGFKHDPSDFDGKVCCKSRVADPLCVYGDEIKHVSEVDPTWFDIVTQESKPKEYFIKFDW